MKTLDRWYGVLTISAEDDSRFPRGSALSLLGAISRGWQLLHEALLAAGDMQSSVSLYYYFEPQAAGSSRRVKLHIYVRVQSRSTKAFRALCQAVEKGAIASFYKFESCPVSPEFPWASFRACCDIVRFGQIRKPTIGYRDNWRVPAVFYEDLPFTANPDCDYLDLDRLGHALCEPFLIHICIQPADVSIERQALAKYCAELADVNRGNRDHVLLPFTSKGSWSSNAGSRLVRLSSKREPLVDEVMRRMQKRRDEFVGPLLLFQCRIFTVDEHTGAQVGSTMARCAFKLNTYAVLTQCDTESFRGLAEACKEGVVGFAPSVLAECAKAEPALFTPLLRLPQLASPAELNGLVRLPIGSTEPAYCICLSTDPPDVPEKDLIVIGHDIYASQPDEVGAPRGITERDLLEKLVIYSLPGEGKTVAIQNIAYQLQQKSISYIIIAPIAGEELAPLKAKDHEDASIRRFARALQVYTPGRDDISPLAFNPLYRFPWMPLTQHLENLKQSFENALHPFPAFRGVLMESLERLFEDFPYAGKPPRMSNLLDCTVRTMRNKGYSHDLASDLSAAIDVRLRPLCSGSLGQIFDLGLNCPDMERLTSGSVLIELDALADTERTTFMIFFLNTLRAYVTQTPYTDTPLRLVVFIDEAHRIAGPGRGTAYPEEA